MKYVLKHKNINVLIIEIDDFAKITKIHEVINENHVPISIKYQNEEKEKSINSWLKNRAIPFGREKVQDILSFLNLKYPQQLLLKSLGLSLSDCYWICPQNQSNSLKWESINLYINTFSDDMGNVLFGDKMHKEINILSPDNSTAGWLKKRWIKKDNKTYLLKAGSYDEQQEPYNEVIATRIMKRLNINHIPYDICYEQSKKDDNHYAYSTCDNFTSLDAEFIPAYDILEHYEKGNKKSNELTDYNYTIQCYKKLGVPNAEEEINKMLVVDYLIANIDRHSNNFGVLRNPDTLEIIGVAPIFDSGTAMWMYEDTYDLANESKPFFSFHSEQIRLVKNFHWLNLELLDGIIEEISDILQPDLAIFKNGLDAERRDYILQKFAENLEQLKIHIPNNT